MRISRKSLFRHFTQYKKSFDLEMLLKRRKSQVPGFSSVDISMQQHVLRTELTDAGLKVTPARLAVLSFLEQANSPLTVDEIYEHIHTEHERADRATIYRIVDTFFQKGITTRLEFGEGKYRYELTGEDHHHLICENCGAVSDISDCNILELEKDITKKKGFTVKRHSLEFYGLCASCQR